MLSGPKPMVCAKPTMVMAKACVASGGTPLAAVNIPAKVPWVLGVPARSPLVPLSDRPVGRLFGNAAKVGAGVPFAVTVKL